jgi:Tfp pilus assembly protein PilF
MRGAEAFRRGDLAAAEEALLEAVRLEPSSAVAHKLLGLTYSAQERYSLAQEPLRRACHLDAREENACYYLGRVYYSLNKYNESLDAFEIALRQKQNDRNRGRVLLGKALTLEALGRDNEAETDYRAAVAAGETRALVDFGMFLFHHGRGDEALPLLRKANAAAEISLVEKSLMSSPALAPVSRGEAVRFDVKILPAVVRNGASGDKHQIETMPAGVAVFDFDNDGWPDIFVANGAAVPSLVKSDGSYSNRLLRNNHDGTFTDVTARSGLAGAGYSMGVAAADYDNDGWVDLFVTGVRSNFLFHNKGNGTFEDVTRSAGLVSDGRWSIAAGWFDYDNDGLLDLFVVRYVEWNPESEPRCAEPPNGERSYCHPKQYAPLPNALYHNEGNGSFRDVSGPSGIGRHLGKGMGVTFGDYDGDGLIDVFVTNDTVRNYLFRNNGNGTFEEVGLAAGVALNADGAAVSSMGADFRDYDNDGREDIFVTDLTNERFLLFRNTGKGQFADVSGPSRIAALSLPWTGWSTGFFDFNNDGLKDIFVAAGNVTDNAELTSSRASRQPNLLFLNRGRVFDLQQLPGAAFHRGAAFGDFNRDGRIDVVLTRLNEPALLLENVTDPVGHWLDIQLEGRRSNRQGIGAKIHIFSRSGEQWNRVTTSVGYGGSSDRTVHFGLGKDTAVDRLEIYWPSGLKQSLHDVAADRYIKIIEE